MSKQSRTEPPVARRIPVEHRRHGDVRRDNYAWMRDSDDPAVISHLEAENAYTRHCMQPVDQLKATLIEEMRSRIVPDEASLPCREGPYLYYHRYKAGGEYPIYCRRLDSMEAPEQVLLDCNELAEGHSYFSLRGLTVSPDHRYAAFGIDTVGNRRYTIGFLDIEANRLLDERIPDVTANLEWCADSETLYYARQHPETLRDYQVLKYRLGGKSELVYQEDDESYWLGVEKSLSGRYLFLVSDSTLKTEVRFLPSDMPDATPAVFLPAADDHEYYVTDGEDRFFVLSNADAVNFRLFECPLDNTAREAWIEVVAHRQNVYIDSVEVFANHLALSIAEDGLDQIEIIDRHSGSRSRIPFEEAVYAAAPTDNLEYRSERLRYSIESLRTPETWFDYDFTNGRSEFLRRDKVPGGFDADAYATERLMVRVRDGTRVPVSLVYRKGLRRNGGAPLLQYGYGSYGISMEADFDADLISLLDRGFVYALAHVRGGAELGRPWYYAGRRKEKMNTFLDFIDVTRHLHAEGYSSPDRCYASGGSAGGLLMGAIANFAPGLYNGIAAHVPFVDVVTTMLDESIPLTTGEFDEWGNPADRQSYRYMLGYSPYDNVREQPYPNLLVTTGLHDSQVQYWEPAKWVARLRECKTDDNLLLLWTDLEAGHGGKSGRYQSLEDTALEYAFFLMLEAQRTA